MSKSRLPDNSATREVPIALGRRLRVRRIDGEWQVAMRRAPEKEDVSKRLTKYHNPHKRAEAYRDLMRWEWHVGQHADILTATARATGVSSFDPGVRELAWYLESLSYEEEKENAA